MVALLEKDGGGWWSWCVSRVRVVTLTVRCMSRHLSPVSVYSPPVIVRCRVWTGSGCMCVLGRGVYGVCWASVGKREASPASRETESDEVTP